MFSYEFNMVLNNEKKLEDIVRRINDKTDTSLTGKIKRTLYMIYVVDIGGCLIPVYQERISKEIGWKEKNLTTANAAIFGLGSSLIYYGGFWLTGDNPEGGTMAILYSYPSFNALQSIFRIAYSQIKDKSLPSISIFAALGSLGYRISDLVSQRKKNRE